MKALTLSLLLTFIASFGYAGGANPNGNGRTYNIMNQSIEENAKLSEVAYNSELYCSGARSARMRAQLPDKAFIVKLKDVKGGFLMMPLQNELVEQIDQTKEKRKITYLTIKDGELKVAEFTLVVDNQWKHENVLGLQLTTAEGQTAEISRFIPIDSDAIYSSVENVSEHGVRCNLHQALQTSELAQAIYQDETETSARNNEVVVQEETQGDNPDEVVVEEDFDESQMSEL